MLDQNLTHKWNLSIIIVPWGMVQKWGIWKHESPVPIAPTHWGAHSIFCALFFPSGSA